MRTRKLVERCFGFGTVFEGLISVSKVKYTVDVSQTFHVVAGMGGSPSSEVAGLTDATGVLVPESPNFTLTDGKERILQLSDGRRMKFLVQNATGPEPVFHIVRNGDWIT